MPDHLPVLCDEVVTLAGNATRLVDGTLGLGGHAAALGGPDRIILGIDRDPSALAEARTILPASVEFLQGAFADPHVLRAIEHFGPDFVLLDLGVSSMQLDLDSRGFSFRPGSLLDMRMDQTGPTAAEWLNQTSPAEMAAAFRDLADERHAGRLARAIGRRRATVPFATADDFVNAIREVRGPQSGPADFARLFQAVRIRVNDELGQLATALPVIRDALQTQGILAVISYHSGEDRVVKHEFREWGRTCVCPPHVPVCSCRGEPLGTVLTTKPIRPTEDEVASNPRARSGRLRAFRTA